MSIKPKFYSKQKKIKYAWKFKVPEQICGMTHRPLAKIVLAPDKISVAIQRGIKVDPVKVRVI